jgi:hypothetical protein
MLKKNKIFISYSTGYVLNNLLSTFFLLYYSFLNQFELTAEIGLISSFTLFFLQSFSGNVRSLLFTNKNFLAKFFTVRLITSLILLIVINIILFVINIKNYFLLIFLSTIFIIQWVFELVLLHNELKKKVTIFNKYILVTVVFIILFIFFNFFYPNQLFIIFSIFLTYIIFQILKFLIGGELLSYSFLERSELKFKFAPFFSSFSLTFANFLWRLLIIFFCGKTLAGIYFSAFAIGSLPGTIFNLTFKSNIGRYIINFKRIDKIIPIIFLLLLFFIFFFMFSFEFIFSHPHKIYLFSALISILGSYFMLRGLYFRQILLQRLKVYDKVFYIDSFYSSIIVLIVPLCFILGNIYLMSFLFFISSLINFFIFKFSYIHYEKKI